ncbi:MAG: Glycosyl transferase family 2 protein [Candidatus Tokpelaia sp. JSC085]|nr:MAG: Glycosyl transferase family 2 protein [Candidatus Tokpelaia sp. JSC085]
MISRRVSIIIPFYNTGAYIGACLKSLIGQTYADIEIICVNDGSTDNSRWIVEDFQKDNKSIHLINRERSGPGIARKNGLENASGQYVMFCDSDDLYDPVMVSVMHSLITATEDIDIAMCSCRLRNTMGTKRRDKHYLINKRNGIFDLTQSLKRAINVVLWNKIYKVDILKRYNINFINETYHEDENFIFKYLSVSRKIHFVNKKLYTYSYRTESLSEKILKNPYHIKEYLHCVEDFLKFLEIHSLLQKNNQYFAEAVIYGYHLTKNKLLDRETKEDAIQKIGYLATKVEMQNINNENLKKSFFTIQRGFKVGDKRTNPLFDVQQKKKTVPVVFSCDDNYIKYLSATLYSVMEYASPTYFYYIIIIDCGIQQNFIDIIKRQLAKCENFSLHIVSAISFLKEHKRSFREKDHFTLAIYGRLLIPKICNHFDRVIYADTDIIFGRDVARLMEIDLKDNCLAATIDSKAEIDRRTNPRWTRYFEKRLSLSIENTYINSGLLVFNLLKWREFSIHEQCIRLLSLSKAKEFIYPDQDVINVTCKNRIFYLDQSWNCACPVKAVLNNPLVIKKVLNSVFLEELTSQYNAAYNGQDTVFHYTSCCKPWNVPDMEKAERWWFFCRKTEYYEQILFESISRQIQMHLIDLRYDSIIDVPTSLKNGNFFIKTLIKTIYFLFMPCFKIKTSLKSKKYYLFGIKFIKIDKINNIKIYYIFGVRIFTAKLIRI